MGSEGGGRWSGETPSRTSISVMFCTAQKKLPEHAKTNFCLGKYSESGKTEDPKGRLECMR